MKNLKAMSASAALTVTLSGATAFSCADLLCSEASETVQSGLLNFVKHIDYAVLSECDPSAETAEIPSEIDGVPVTEILESACYQCAALTEVQLPSSLESIGYRAFEGCTGLTGLMVPDSVTVIGDYAFSGCSGLTSAYIGDGTVTIRGSAFADCSALKTIRLPDGIKTLSNTMFFGCSSLESIVLPKQLQFIGRYAFSGCSSLTEIIIPENVTAIRSSAFSDCTNLKTVIIPENVETIESAAFKNCPELTIRCAEGSAADQYAAERRIPVEIIDFSQFVPTGVFGDVDGDGEVTIFDSVKILIGVNEEMIGLDWADRTLSKEQAQIGDIDGDGELTPFDSACVLKYYNLKFVAGLEWITWDDVLPEKAEA